MKKAPKTKVPSKAPKAAPAPKAAAPKTAVSTVTTKAKAVVITSSKVCQAFAKRAAGLSAAIKAAKPGASVTIDERVAEGRKPDRGSFCVSVGGTDVVSCKSMPRPFATMKALDMDAVAKKVIALL